MKLLLESNLDTKPTSKPNSHPKSAFKLYHICSNTLFQVFFGCYEVITWLFHNLSPLQAQPTNNVHFDNSLFVRYISKYRQMHYNTSQLRVIQKMLDDHHLHHELYWRVAMTTKWLHQLQIMGIDIDMASHPTFGQTIIQVKLHQNTRDELPQQPNDLISSKGWM